MPRSHRLSIVPIYERHNAPDPRPAQLPDRGRMWLRRKSVGGITVTNAALPENKRARIVTDNLAVLQSGVTSPVGTHSGCTARQLRSRGLYLSCRNLMVTAH
jgi:hypothetical protein